MFLLGAGNMDHTLQAEERIDVENIFHADVPTGYIQPSLIAWPDKGDAHVGVDSLARQYRICGRGQRSVSVNHVFLGKSSILRTTKRLVEQLSKSVGCAYTSLPCRNWAVASDHYVFELRHILI